MNAVDLGLLATIAVIMSLLDAFILKWAAEVKTRTSGALVLFLAFMMIAMLVGAFIYERAPSSGTLVAGLWIASLAMSVGALPPFLVFLGEATRQRAEGEDTLPSPLAHRRWFGLAVVATVVANEFLMGATFQLAAGIAAPAAASLTEFIAYAVNSPWFLFPMSLEMATAAVLLRSHLPKGVWVVLLAQSGLMVLAPPASTNVTWIDGAVVAGSAVMIGIIIYLMEYIYQHRQLTTAFSNYIVALMGIFALMMSGLFVWLYYGDGFLFAAAVLVEMTVFFDAIVDAGRFSGSADVPWQLRANWAFSLLALIFVAELFMGAVLDVVILPGVYVGAFPALPLSGPAGAVAYNAFYNGFWFLAAVVGSTWFLAMMGIEMGALVVFKMRESVSRENKIRMGLMLGCYALFATFFPSFYYSALFPNAPAGTDVPVLGWSMGLGSAPIVPSLFLVIFLTYVVFGALSLLFGRRVICSVFCTAPLMYQGTTMDAMKTFNRSSWPGKKYLGSRLSSVYSATAGLTMATLAAVSFASYFDQQGVLNVTILGSDPSVFFFAVSFSIAWYLLFVTIPYAGNYNCVTMGWCYTGIISGAFQKAGFFKLKVRSKQVCRDCTTLDCAKGCPVGLVDMPGHFRTKGEFRSHKCCGVGDCVESCPYDNLYVADVRHWVRRRLGRPETRPRREGVAGPPPQPGSPAMALTPAQVTVPYGLEPLPMVTGQPRRSTGPEPLGPSSGGVAGVE